MPRAVKGWRSVIGQMAVEKTHADSGKEVSCHRQFLSGKAVKSRKRSKCGVPSSVISRKRGGIPTW